MTAWLGTLSYSLYLWQEPFLYYKGTSWITAFPQNVVLAVAAAVMSYYVIERPFLRLKDAWSRRPDTQDAAISPPPGARQFA
jgi:peptidoglycan/LPS O-acetylase OafA/YrhL